MYQARTRHPLSPPLSDLSESVIETLWEIFLAIGTSWRLTDEPQQYRGRFLSFLENRIALNPIYPGLYELTSTYLTDSKADKGAEAAFQSLFFVKDRGSAPGVPESPLEFIQTYVVNELIALRLALGGFADFGAINYCGFFGGANMPDRSAPYRTF